MKNINIQSIQIIKQLLRVHFVYQLNDKRIAAVTNEERINIFDIYNHYKCDITIKPKLKEKIVFICQLDNGDLVTYSNAFVIRLYGITKTSYIQKYGITIKKSCNITILVSIANNCFVTYDINGHLKIWKGDKSLLFLK